MSRLSFFLSFLVPLLLGFVVIDTARPVSVQAQQWCRPADPDYCVNRVCQRGDGDCDPGQCAPGLACIDDVGARYGLPAHYDVCETASSSGGGGGSGRADPDYCVYNYCGIGDGDCDPGQCDEGTCVDDVGANYGLPAHYDVCEAGEGGSVVTPDPPQQGTGAERQLRALIGSWAFTITIEGSQATWQYRFEQVRNVSGTWILTGRDPVDSSDFFIVRTQDLDVALDYTFFMTDLDRIDGQNTCSSFVFNHTGNRLNGIVALSPSPSGRLEDCDLNRGLAGTFVGRRQ